MLIVVRNFFDIYDLWNINDIFNGQFYGLPMKAYELLEYIISDEAFDPTEDTHCKVPGIDGSWSFKVVMKLNL